MEVQNTSFQEPIILNYKLKEFIQSTKNNIESKSQQINTLIESMKSENDHLIAKCKFFLLIFNL